MRSSTSIPTEEGLSNWSNPSRSGTPKKVRSTSAKIGSTKIFFLYQRMGVRPVLRIWLKTFLDVIRTHETLPPFRNGRAVVVRVSPDRIVGIGMWSRSVVDPADDDAVDHHFADGLGLKDFRTQSEIDQEDVRPSKDRWSRPRLFDSIWDH